MRIIRAKIEDGKLIAIMANMYDEVGNPIDYKDIELTTVIRRWKAGKVPMHQDYLLDARNMITEMKEEAKKEKDVMTEALYIEEIKAIDYLLYKATNPK